MTKELKQKLNINMNNNCILDAFEIKKKNTK